MSRYPHLLSNVTLGALRLPNRVIMAPMTRNRARGDGTVPPICGEYFAQRSSAGLLITDATMTSRQAVGYPNTPGIWTEEQMEAWRAVVDEVHAVGGLIALQLMHCGRISLEAWQPDKAMPVSSSPVRAATTMLRTPTLTREPASDPRALELGEIPDVVAQFAQAARRGREAGFDAVEIHGANGYLIDQFLRSAVNRRHDRYGGSAENRARFLLEVTEAVAKEFGADRTGVRLSPDNPHNDMRDDAPLETFGTALRQLAALELAWVHLASMGDTDLCRRLRDVHQKPFILNGDFTAESADSAIRSELAIAVSFGRAYLANPDLVERFERDAPLNTPDPDSFHGGAAQGYTDYPLLEDVEHHDY